MIERPWLDEIDESAAANDRSNATQTPDEPKKFVSQKRAYFWAAEVRGEKLPSRDDFKKYTCLNVTNRGASFVWPTAEINEHVIIAMGTAEAATYFLAKVLSSTEMPDGKYQIDCEFLERY